MSEPQPTRSPPGAALRIIIEWMKANAGAHSQAAIAKETGLNPKTVYQTFWRNADKGLFTETADGHQRVLVQDPVTLAIVRASRVSAETIDAVLDPVRDAFRAMREGVATELQWAVLASSVNMAMTIENQRVVNGLAAHLRAAEQALHQIRLRAMTTAEWKPTALYYQEIEALDEFIPLHRFQLEQLSQGELIKAMDTTEAVIRSIKGHVIRVGAHQATQQMSLLGAPA